MNLRRSISLDDNFVLNQVAKLKCELIVGPRGGVTCKKGSHRTWFNRSVRSLIQRGFLSPNKDGQLELAGEALKEFGPQLRHPAPKRTFRMSRTRAARVQDP